MSGRKQHTIPRLVLQNFSLKRGSGSFVWLARRKNSPRLVNIRDAAAERDFYSKPVLGQVSLDDQITDYEQRRFAPLVRSLVERTYGDVFPSSDAAELITHLVVRASHTRSVLTVASQQLLRALGEAISKPEWWRKTLGYDRPDGGKVMELVRAEIAKHPEVTPPQRDFFERTMFALVGQSFLSPGRVAQIKSRFAEVSKDTETRIKEIHEKNLGDAMAPQPRVDRLSKLRWTVEELSCLILPDCIAIEFGKTKYWPSVLIDDELTIGAVFPFAPDRALVGRAEDSWSVPLDLNRRMAECSFRFFVSREEPPDEYSGLIGSGVERILGETIDAALKSVFA